MNEDNLDKELVCKYFECSKCRNHTIICIRKTFPEHKIPAKFTCPVCGTFTLKETNGE